MKYDAVVISGLPGAGKGILAKKLAELYKWKVVSAGNLWRERYRTLYPNKEVNFEDYWKRISLFEQKHMDEHLRALIEKGNIIGDFRYAKSCVGVRALFVFLTSDITIRAKRALATRKYSGKMIEEIKDILKEREKDEVEIGKKIYGEDYDFRDEKYYNLILDSGTLSLAEEINVINKEMKNDKL